MGGSPDELETVTNSTVNGKSKYVVPFDFFDESKQTWNYY